MGVILTLMQAISLIFWCNVYYLCIKQNPEAIPERHSRLLTLLHGTVASVIGFLQCSPWSLTMNSFNAKNCMTQYAMMVWSWGYFCFDLAWCLRYSRDQILMIFHHLSAVIAVNIYLYKTHTGCIFPCTMTILEITNPYLQIRWLLRDAGYSRSNIYNIVECVYVGLFFLLRGILSTFIIFKIFTSDVFDTETKVLSFLLYSISLAFIYQIYGYLQHRYAKSQGPERIVPQEIRSS